MVLFVLRKLILQTRMHSHPVGLDVWFLVGPFVYFQTLCVRTAKALVSLRGCAGSPEPSLVAYVISTIISWAGCIMLFTMTLLDICTLYIFAYLMSHVTRKPALCVCKRQRRRSACVSAQSDRRFSCLLLIDSIIWVTSWENLFSHICEQQRRRSAGASDQCLCCSPPG